MRNYEVEVLLVEDNEGDAELAIRALKRKNFANKLIHLANGADALDYIFGRGPYQERDVNNMPKVILLDLNMPKVSGMEVLEKVKSDKRTQNIPIVILTSSREDPDIDKCFRLGANSYIVKPVEFEKFIGAVAEIGYYWLILNQPPSH